MRRKTRHTRDDRGASAVEFALLFPVFLLICFGTISGGIVFSDKLAVSQGVREAARYGATLPYDPSSSLSRTNFLKTVQATAIEYDFELLGSAGVAYCVAVRSATNEFHLPAGASAEVAGPCPGNTGPARPHVLVFATKPGVFDLILARYTFTITSTSVARYEKST